MALAHVASSLGNHSVDRGPAVPRGVAKSTSVKRGICFRRGIGVRIHGGVEDRGICGVLADGETIRVDALTVDSFIASGNPLPRVIKIDVEGDAEYGTLRVAPSCSQNADR
jgi:hypothetical protein